MKLYYTETMNPRKVCATAKYLGVPLDYVKIRLGPAGTRTPEFLAINPNGAAPALVDGDRTLTESAAIAAHLAAKAGSPLWPIHDALELGEVLRWISWDAFHWTRAIGPIYFERVIRPKLGLGTPDPEVLAKAMPMLDRFAPVLDAHLAGREFVANDRLSIADFCLGAMLPDHEAMGLPLDRYPNVVAWHDRLLAIEAFRDPWPAEFTRFAA